MDLFDFLHDEELGIDIDNPRFHHFVIDNEEILAQAYINELERTQQEEEDDDEIDVDEDSEGLFVSPSPHHHLGQFDDFDDDEDEDEDLEIDLDDLEVGLGRALPDWHAHLIGISSGDEEEATSSDNDTPRSPHHSPQSSSDLGLESDNDASTASTPSAASLIEIDSDPDSDGDETAEGNSEEDEDGSSTDSDNESIQSVDIFQHATAQIAALVELEERFDRFHSQIENLEQRRLRLQDGLLDLNQHRAASDNNWNRALQILERLGEPNSRSASPVARGGNNLRHHPYRPARQESRSRGEGLGQGAAGARRRQGLGDLLGNNNNNNNNNRRNILDQEAEEDQLVEMEFGRQNQEQAQGRRGSARAPAVIDLTDEPDSPQGGFSFPLPSLSGNGGSNARNNQSQNQNQNQNLHARPSPRPTQLPGRVNELLSEHQPRQINQHPNRTSSNPRRPMPSLNRRTPSLTRSDGSLLGTGGNNVVGGAPVIDLTMDDDLPAAPNNRHQDQNNNRRARTRPPPAIDIVDVDEDDEVLHVAPPPGYRAPAPRDFGLLGQLFGGAPITGFGLIRRMGAALGQTPAEVNARIDAHANRHLGNLHAHGIGILGGNMNNPLGGNVPDLNYRNGGADGGRNGKPKHEPPPKARDGFGRSTGEDVAFVCAACDEELKYDPDEVEDKKPPSKKQKTSRKDQEEHFFWAVKECGHVGFLLLLFSFVNLTSQPDIHLCLYAFSCLASPRFAPLLFRPVSHLLATLVFLSASDLFR